MEMLRKISRNRRGRDFAVGDVHGHLAQLKRQLAQLHFDPAVDRLFFIGDLVDRGPDSAAVLSLVDQTTYLSTIGNHEAMMIAGFEDSARAYLHLSNGGDWFYELPEAQQRDLVARVRTWPWAMEVDIGDRCVGLVHANVPASSWQVVREQLLAAEPAWQSGASLSDTAVDYAAKNLLWDRSLILRLYSDVLESSEIQQLIARHLQNPARPAEFEVPGTPAQLQPFLISDIDAVCMGHTYVPTPLRAGKCHFLDSYRGDPGEQLGLVPING